MIYAQLINFLVHSAINLASYSFCGEIDWGEWSRTIMALLFFISESDTDLRNKAMVLEIFTKMTPTVSECSIKFCLVRQSDLFSVLLVMFCPAIINIAVVFIWKSHFYVFSNLYTRQHIS